MTFQKIFTSLKSFREDLRGSVAVEAVIMLPILFWAFVAMAVFFDVFRSRSTTEKAAFTVSDILSRETEAVGADYIDSVHDLYKEISWLNHAGEMRVSVIAWDPDTNQYFLDWSHITGTGSGGSALTDGDLPAIEDKLPVLVPGERLILVETFGSYTPPFDVGLGVISMNTFVFTRPRFGPQLAWSDSA